MGIMEPDQGHLPHEVGIVIEVVSPSQEESDATCAYVRSTLLHYGYPGRISTAGNLAFLYSPSNISYGEIYEFNIYHLMDIHDPLSLFPITVHEVHS